jgi:hypothetical protein
LAASSLASPRNDFRCAKNGNFDSFALVTDKRGVEAAEASEYKGVEWPPDGGRLEVVESTKGVDDLNEGAVEACESDGGKPLSSLMMGDVDVSESRNSSLISRVVCIVSVFRVKPERRKTIDRR